MIESVTDENFEEKVLNSEIPVLVDFWAEWCGPCKMLSPILEQIANDYEGKLKIVKMNVDESPKTPSSKGIRGIPTMMLFSNGKQIDSKVGVIQKPTLSSWIDSNI